jgi:septal ring factor EnvC (AmiA/AmiB activator)
MRRFTTVLLVLSAGAAVWCTASSGTPAPRQATDRLTALQREAESLAQQERTLLGELRQLQVDRDLKAEILRRTEDEIALVAQQRAEAQQRVALLEQQVARETPLVKARLVELYKLGRPGYLRLLLDVRGMQSAARVYRMVSAQVDADRRRLAAFEQAIGELRATEKSLADRGARVEALQSEALAARQAAEQAVARHATLVAKIDTRRDLTARLLGELQAADERLAALDPAPSAAAALARVPLSSMRGSLDWPSAGVLRSRFGQHRDPRFGTTTVRSGVEIAVQAGAPVIAVEDGVVAYAQPFTGFGNLVIVDHGARAYSLYGYLDSIEVGRGDHVVRGQRLGSSGTAPGGAPGIYFELRIDGKAVDPVQWLKRR